MSRRPIADCRLPADIVMHYDSDLREYRVTFLTAEIATAFVRLGLPIPPGALRERSEAIAYYTNDRGDAIGTARHMSQTSTLRDLVGEQQWRHVKPTRIGTTASADESAQQRSTQHA